MGADALALGTHFRKKLEGFDQASAEAPKAGEGEGEQETLWLSVRMQAHNESVLLSLICEYLLSSSYISGSFLGKGDSKVSKNNKKNPAFPLATPLSFVVLQHEMGKINKYASWGRKLS